MMDREYFNGVREGRHQLGEKEIVEGYVMMRRKYRLISDGCLGYMMRLAGEYGVELVGLDLI